MPKTKKNMFHIFGLVLGIFILSLLIDNQKVHAASWPVNQSESNIFDDHVHVKLTFTKNHSANYTAVGDIVTVTTEFTKLDDVPLDEAYDQSSAVVLYPDESQGLELIGQPTYTIQLAGATDTGEFVPDSKILVDQVINSGFNTYATIYQDDFKYSGVITPIKVTESTGLDDFNQEPRYSDEYSLKNVLVKKGTVVQLSYQARVTQAAVDKHIGKGFTLHSAIYDSSIGGSGDFDFDHGFLTAEMPGIQVLGVAFDDSSLNQELDLKDANAVHLTGTWQSDQTVDVTKTLTVNGTEIPIPAGSFKDDGTFDMTLDLSNYVSDTLTSTVAIDLKDSNGQVANDSTTIQFVQTNESPEIQLTTPTEGSVTDIYQSSREVPIEFKWRDNDSATVSLSYTLDNGTSVVLEKDTANATPGQWQTYKGKLSWADALALGTHPITINASDSDGANANPAANFQLNVLADVLGFKVVDDVIEFPNLAISSQLVQVNPLKPVNVVITDSMNNPDNWRLSVKQTTEFTSGDQVLKGATLDFISGAKTQSLRNNTEEVDLPTRQVNPNEYQLLEDANDHFQLDVPSGNLAGNYQASLEWTIVTAP